MAEVTISPELMEKLSNASKMYIRHFYDYHKDAVEGLKECNTTGILAFLYAERSKERAEDAIARDIVDGRISRDERSTIVDRIDDFEEAKRRELFDALEKCGCKFK